ncbi:MAG: LSU ribosomal protein L11p (L12e), partial [uncultured Ramlibacter sp.]
GEENRRFCQAASAGWQGQSVAPHRPRAGPARPEHHGVLQGVQRADPGCRAGPAAAGGHHRLRGQELHLHHQDAAGDHLDQEGDQAGQGFGQAAQRQGRQDHPGPARGDRQDQAQGHERGRHQCGRQDPGRLRPVDGRHRGGRV